MVKIVFKVQNKDNRVSSVLFTSDSNVDYVMDEKTGYVQLFESDYPTLIERLAHFPVVCTEKGFKVLSCEVIYG